MARRVRQTHKERQRELQQADQVEVKLWSLSDWMETNWRPVVGVVAAVTVIWGGIGLWQIASASADDGAARATAPIFEAQARPIYTAPAPVEGAEPTIDPNMPSGPTWPSVEARSEAVVQVAESADISDAPDMIATLVGGAKGQLGDYEAQLASVDAMLAKVAGAALELPLRQARATALAALGRADEAAVEWQKVAEQALTPEGQALAWLEVGMVHVSGAKADPVKAKAAFEAAVKAARPGDADAKKGTLAWVAATANLQLAHL